MKRVRDGLYSLLQKFRFKWHRCNSGGILDKIYTDNAAQFASEVYYQSAGTAADFCQPGD